jgi:CysZ protein
MLPASTVDPVLSSTSRFSELLSGMGLPFRAFKLVLTTPRLLLLSLFCAVVTGITLIGLLIFLWPLATWISEHWIGTGGGWRNAAGTGVSVLLYLLLLVVGALTVPNLLLAPLQDPLSEATEAKLGNFTAPDFTFGRLVQGTVTSLLHTISRLALMLIGLLVLLPLNLIPVAGSVLYGVLSAIWSMWWVCAEYLSGPMARHLLPFRAVLAAMRASPFKAMGMGATLYVVLWLPVLNCFLVPLAVVAGTLLYRALPPSPARGT